MPTRAPSGACGDCSNRQSRGVPSAEICVKVLEKTQKLLVSVAFNTPSFNATFVDYKNRHQTKLLRSKKDGGVLSSCTCSSRRLDRRASPFGLTPRVRGQVASIPHWRRSRSPPRRCPG